jgi:alginate O-acetyltransferase complex protein AlgI
MLFSSISFLYYFLPLFLLAYFIVPNKIPIISDQVNVKNTILLIGSLVFYVWGEARYVFLLLLAIISAYLFGFAIDRFRNQQDAHGKKTKTVFICAIVFQAGLLIWYKYVDFIIINVNHFLPGNNIPLLQLALPLGISFYTFQILSYIIDLYQGRIKLQRNLAHLAIYVLLFPQLVAGPVVRYLDIEGELKKRKINLQSCGRGVRRFVVGLAKKVLLADTIGELCRQYNSGIENSVLFVWLYGISFTLQIYFDFSGYSDMAIGLGKILGFQFPENFRYPYMSKSITEFWRRWHITLSSWFRDYIYIPLGGNRVSTRRYLINLMLVWLLTGFWHGAGWQYAIWGLYHAFWLILEKMWSFYFPDQIKFSSQFFQGIWSLWQSIRTMIIIIVGWILFAADSLEIGFTQWGRMFGQGVDTVVGAESLYYLQSYLVLLLLCIFGMTNVLSKLTNNYKNEKWILLLQPLGLIGMMVLITAHLIDGSYQPFIYFRF